MSKQAAINAALKNVLEKVLTSLKSMSMADVKETINNLKNYKPQRPMKFPYTFSAKIAQFPIMFYHRNNWIWGYYPYGFLLSTPVFWYISRLANSPENKRIWAEKRRKEREEHH